MGHNSWRRPAELIERTQAATADRELVADAKALVEKWNADLERRRQAQYGYAARQRFPQFSPHIGAALLADRPILHLWCPACEQTGELDLRKVVRPPDFSIDRLYDALVCTFGGCRGRGDAPPPVMLGLYPALR